MTYAIVQKQLVVPELDQLKRAFSVSPLLTGIDAQTVVNDAYGILLRGQELEHARTLQEALLREQVETELVEEAKLPSIPSARIMSQVEFHPKHLKVLDPMLRVSEVPWNQIMFIAAGYVRTREFHKHRTALDESLSGGPAGLGQDLLSSVGTREESQHHLLLDLFLLNGTTRYSMSADEFSFDHLGGRLSDDPAINFVFLVQDLAEEAPNAGLNRGAFMACQRPPELFPYPNKAAFNEEIIWMLWRIGQIPTGSHPTS